MATVNISPVLADKYPRFIFCLNALAINTSLSTTALSGRHIYQIGQTPTTAMRRTISHTNNLDTTNHYVTVPNTGYYEVSIGFSCVISGLLTEMAMCRNWLQHNNAANTPPNDTRMLYINAPVDSSVSGRVSYFRSAVSFLNAGDTLQLIEIGVGNTDFENFSITIKEL